MQASVSNHRGEILSELTASQEDCLAGLHIILLLLIWFLYKQTHSFLFRSHKVMDLNTYRTSIVIDLFFNNETPTVPLGTILPAIIFPYAEMIQRCSSLLCMTVMHAWPPSLIDYNKRTIHFN